jgi:xanthine dehydrogenase accessory factor
MERLLRSPTAGTFKPYVAIGDLVRAGDVVAVVGRTAVKAEISGVIRGLLREGIEVKEGYKVGDVDPRAKVSHCHTISDKSRSVGGGVLEAIMMFLFGVKNSTGQKR